jgi:hypothetical protein
VLGIDLPRWVRYTATAGEIPNAIPLTHCTHIVTIRGISTVRYSRV